MGKPDRLHLFFLKYIEWNCLWKGNLCFQNYQLFGEIVGLWFEFNLYWSLQEQELANNVFEDDPGTFWESDGSHGRHYIRLHMKAGVVIQYVSYEHIHFIKRYANNWFGCCGISIDLQKAFDNCKL